MKTDRIQNTTHKTKVSNDAHILRNPELFKSMFVVFLSSALQRWCWDCFFFIFSKKKTQKEIKFPFLWISYFCATDTNLQAPGPTLLVAPPFDPEAPWPQPRGLVVSGPPGTVVPGTPDLQKHRSSLSSGRTTDVGLLFWKINFPTDRNCFFFVNQTQQLTSILKWRACQRRRYLARRRSLSTQRTPLQGFIQRWTEERTSGDSLKVAFLVPVFIFWSWICPCTWHFSILSLKHTLADAAFIPWRLWGKKRLLLQHASRRRHVREQPFCFSHQRNNEGRPQDPVWYEVPRLNNDKFGKTKETELCPNSVVFRWFVTLALFGSSRTVSSGTKSP